MSITVLQRGASARLTTPARVRVELTGIPTSDDAFLDRLCASASAAIHSYCNRAAAPFYRQSYTEVIGAYGDTHLMLRATPLVVVTAVLQDGSVLTDYSIEDALAGLLYRQNQFFWSAQRNAGLSGRQTFPMFGSPIPLSEELRFSVSYIGGWLVPDQDLASRDTVSVAASDHSFNDSAAGFPALLQAGDVVVNSAFNSALNNGGFTVTGTPTRSKFTVAEAVVDESAGALANLTFSNLPADLEQAAIQTVKAWYLDREKAPHSRRERVGDYDLEYTDPVGITTALPVTAVGFLRSYMRMAA